MIYEGTLRSISGGSEIQGVTRSYWTHNMGITREHRVGGDVQHGYIRREFVDIGDTRIIGLVLTPLYDELLQEAVGKQIALSCIGPEKGRVTVVAMQTPDGGLTKPPLGRLGFAAMRMLLRKLVGAVILGVVVAFIGLVAVAFTTEGDDTTIAMIVPVSLFGGTILLVEGLAIRRIARSFAAASALDRRAAQLVRT